MTEILKYEILLVILKTNKNILFKIKSITYLLLCPLPLTALLRHQHRH